MLKRDSSSFPAAYHDIGGDSTGAVEFREEPWEYWEKEVEAIRNLLGDATRRMVSLDELRHAFETFGKEKYDRRFYERRMLAMIEVAIKKGIITREELDQRVRELQARLAARA